MPFVRNPFRKQDENARPTIIDGVKENSKNNVKSVDTSEKRPTEYALSEINDSGVCLPPSPEEQRKTSFWGGTNSSFSTTSSNHRSLIKENEQFNISRESFDSYRRSFDISGRSPVIRPNEYIQRGSLDSRSFQSPPRLSDSLVRPGPVPILPPLPPAPREEDFEDVGLEDAKPQQVKKKGIFARLTESSNDQQTAGADARPASSHEKSSWHHFGGRKRGQSGQGAELASIPDIVVPQREITPKPVEHGLKKPATPTVVEITQAPAS